MSKHCYALCALSIALASPALAASGGAPDRTRIEAPHPSGTVHVFNAVLADVRRQRPDLVPVALLNLAGALVREGALDAAEANAQEARALLAARAPGVDLAESFNILGAVAERRGRFAQAEAHYRRALAIASRVRPASDRRVVNYQTNLAILLTHEGRGDEALALAGARAKAFEAGLTALLGDGNEEGARDFLRSENPFALFASIGKAEPLARAVVNYQGIVTDAMASLHARSSPRQREAFARWTRARSALSQWQITSPAMRRGGPAHGEKLAAQLAAAQRAFARTARAPLRFDVTVGAIANGIAADAALVNYVRYSRYLGRGRWEDRYGALVMTRARAPRWIDLASAQEIDAAAEVYGRAVRGREVANPLPDVLRALHAQLLAPALRQLPATVGRLLIVQDGMLNLLSFATLLDGQDRFVGERYDVSYLASARAVLRAAATPAQPRTARIYADPSFLLARQGGPGRGATPFQGFEPPRLDPLPHTRAEAAAVRDVLGQAGWRTTVVAGAAASERNVRAMAAPAVLHFATHGLWLPAFGVELFEAPGDGRGVGSVSPLRPPAQDEGAGDLRQAWRAGQVWTVERLSAHDPDLSNPMHRNVIALAGARDTYERWQEGKVGPLAADGMLSAEEASMLDLAGTWLVTLASCDSGVGEPEPGEGVVGLRRGFLQAGARNVLATLWPVADEWTPRLMTAFYAQAAAGTDAARALARVQREQLAALRKDAGVEAAARVAGAFVLTSQAAGAP